ncbi:hypothetical protein JMJ77_0001488 [Colletotrichum scovillei]|uniref:Amidohydrolase-related domain-containing protein n=1 Tax=Colletotrichum scovillei TaxID=1209932 RepID=A0A9P7QRV5_9PEZI|nr:hypothetical protein JMJ77_0001488 [Colletotrichum scovillei]KAG7060362.1 hypothetical protein JMJ76_0006274 [Colletotrichum scovillei]
MPCAHCPNLFYDEFRQPKQDSPPHDVEWEVVPTITLKPGRPHQLKSALTCIFADLMIPGRGEPIYQAAVGISIESGAITYVGTQTGIDDELAAAPRMYAACLMPGLWDCHIHYCGVGKVDYSDIILNHPATAGAVIARSFYDTLMSGVTSVKEMSGYGLEAYAAVKAGYILGPTVYGAGAAIGMTGGGCDGVTLPLDVVWSYQGIDNVGQRPWAGQSVFALADGVEECRKAVRQQIRRGATVIKVLATGSVMSVTDDPRFRSYSDEELRVIVQEAAMQGRGVSAHAHGKEGIIAAVKAGVRTIEHGSYIDQEAADLMVKHGVTLVATAYITHAGLKNVDRVPPETAAKLKHIAAVAHEAYCTAVKARVKIALGTDICSGDPDSIISPGHSCEEVFLATKAGLTPLQAIEAATINAAETLGTLAPKKGLIKVGWDADLIAFDQNPLQDMKLFLHRDSIRYVWKGGKLVKGPDQKGWPATH